MPIRFECPACKKRTQAPEELAGRKARCPNCQAVINVPDLPEPVEEADEAPQPAPAPARRAPARRAEDDEPEEQRRPCPMCGEMILATAVKCRYCGEVFDETLRRTERKRRRRHDPGDEDLTTAEYVLAFLCSGIACIIGIVWMIQGKPKGTKMFVISLVMVFVWTGIRLAIESAVRP
jgi:hypothetical protein